MGIHFILRCFKVKSKKMKTFILIVACIGLYSAFELSELLSGSDRNFCCAFINAKQQCHDTCSGQPCENTCEARCGAGSVCGSWPCGEVNDGGCTRTATTRAPTTPACLPTGDTCVGTTLSCCSGLTCTPTGCQTSGGFLATAAPTPAPSSCASTGTLCWYGSTTGTQTQGPVPGVSCCDGLTCFNAFNLAADGYCLNLEGWRSC